MSKKLYKLKETAAPHVHLIDGEAVEIQPGETVQDERDLCEMFPQKFEVVSVPVIIGPATEQPHIPVPDEVPVLGEEDKATPPPSLPSEDEEEEGGKAEPKKTATKKKKEEDKKKAPDYGTDVTEDFKLAVEVGFKVFSKNKKYTVIDPDDGSVVNKDPLKKAEVSEFLQSQVVDDEDEDEEDEE